MPAQENPILQGSDENEKMVPFPIVNEAAELPEEDDDIFAGNTFFDKHIPSKNIEKSATAREIDDGQKDTSEGIKGVAGDAMHLPRMEKGDAAALELDQYREVKETLLSHINDILHNKASSESLLVNLTKEVFSQMNRSDATNLITNVNDAMGMVIPVLEVMPHKKESIIAFLREPHNWNQSLSENLMRQISEDFPQQSTMTFDDANEKKIITPEEEDTDEDRAFRAMLEEETPLPSLNKETTPLPEHEAVFSALDEIDEGMMYLGKFEISSEINKALGYREITSEDGVKGFERSIPGNPETTIKLSQYVQAIKNAAETLEKSELEDPDVSVLIKKNISRLSLEEVLEMPRAVITEAMSAYAEVINTFENEYGLEIEDVYRALEKHLYPLTLQEIPNIAHQTLPLIAEIRNHIVTSNNKLVASQIQTQVESENAIRQGLTMITRIDWKKMPNVLEQVRSRGWEQVIALIKKAGVGKKSTKSA